MLCTGLELSEEDQLEDCPKNVLAFITQIPYTIIK